MPMERLAYALEQDNISVLDIGQHLGDPRQLLGAVVKVTRMLNV